jgi:hypothetical protein
MDKRQTTSKAPSPQIASKMTGTMVATTKPTSMMKLPLRISQKPRLRPDSSAASPAVTLEQGYSPPTPTPVKPFSFQKLVF